MVNTSSVVSDAGHRGWSWGFFLAVFIFIYYSCVGTHATAHTWGSENNPHGLLLSFMWVGGTELRLLDLCGKSFYQASHLASLSSVFKMPVYVGA